MFYMEWDRTFTNRVCWVQVVCHCKLLITMPPAGNSHEMSILIIKKKKKGKKNNKKTTGRLLQLWPALFGLINIDDVPRMRSRCLLLLSKFSRQQVDDRFLIHVIPVKNFSSADILLRLLSDIYSKPLPSTTALYFSWLIQQTLIGDYVYFSETIKTKTKKQKKKQKKTGFDISCKLSPTIGKGLHMSNPVFWGK